MYLNVLDWVIVCTFLVLILVIGLSFSKSASKNLESFFLGGRNLPWWLAGLSMVATTFAADTPLSVTELVRKNGISGNWLWWNFLAGGMLTTFFFARLWRRSGVLTEVAFIEKRYTGQTASFLRGFKAIYLGVFMNAIIIAWVNVAMMTIFQVFFELNTYDSLMYTAGIMLLAVMYSSVSGLKGIAVTDAIQFALAMIGCFFLAYFTVQSDQIGGLYSLKEQLIAQDGQILHFLPSIGEQTGSSSLAIGIVGLLAYAGFQWWACWYPGAEPGGGGYVAQRMMSTPTEKDSMYATLFFQVAHYCLRPWVWIVVALCTLILYPDLAPEEYKYGFVYAMRDHLPHGWKGLLFVAFMAAYMSTISTQLNWGAGYLVNDVYKRFIRPEKTDRHYVWASRLSTILLMCLGLALTTMIKTISGAWEFILQSGAGLGLVLILRWYWKRISAWSEIVATVVPFIITGIIYMFFDQWTFEFSLIVTALITTVAWIIVTWLFPQKEDAELQRFWEHLHGKKVNIFYSWIAWLSAITFAYSFLFGVGKIIFLEWQIASILCMLCLVSLWILQFAIKRANF